MDEATLAAFSQAVKLLAEHPVEHHILDDDKETARDVVRACDAALRRLRKKGKRK